MKSVQIRSFFWYLFSPIRTEYGKIQTRKISLFAHYEFMYRNPFAQDSANFYFCFQQALLHSDSYFIFLYWSPSSWLCAIFDSVSSTIDEASLINPYTNVFVFGDFNVHHKDWLTYSGGTNRPGELCYIFFSQMTLLRWLTSLLRSLTVIPTVLLFCCFFLFWS